MGIAVISSAFSAILSEFGIIPIINKLLTPPIIKPLFGLPGVASLGIITTYLSDNPAIISLAYENDFKKNILKKISTPCHYKSWDFLWYGINSVNFHDCPS